MVLGAGAVIVSPFSSPLSLTLSSPLSPPLSSPIPVVMESSRKHRQIPPLIYVHFTKSKPESMPSVRAVLKVVCACVCVCVCVCMCLSVCVCACVCESS